MCPSRVLILFWFRSCPLGFVFSFVRGSDSVLGSVLVLWGRVLGVRVLVLVPFWSLGFRSGPWGSVLGSVDIFEFLLRRKE